MIVLDASAAIELLLGTARGRRIAAAVGDEALSAPHLLDVEVAQVLRRLEAGGHVSADRARGALDDLRALGVHRTEHDVLLGRVWALRANLTAYDAVYVALAEASEATLVTCDARVARAPGHRAQVALVE